MFNDQYWDWLEKMNTSQLVQQISSWWPTALAQCYLSTYLLQNVYISVSNQQFLFAKYPVMCKQDVILGKQCKSH